MASTIKLKTGTGSAVPSSLAQGEVGINIDNGLFYFGSGSTNTVKQLDSFTNITASSVISSSGEIHASSFRLNNNRITYTNDDIALPDTGLYVAGGHITASGNISSSGNIFMQSTAGTSNVVVVRDTSGKLVTDIIDGAVWGGSGAVVAADNANELLSVVSLNEVTVGIATRANRLTGTPSLPLTHITASGNISSSGTITAITASIQHLDGPEGGGISFASGNPTLKGEDGAQITLTDDVTISGGNNTLRVGTIVNVNTIHITASGNISASGNVIAGNVFMPAGAKISFDDDLDGSDQFIGGGENYITIEGDDFVKLRADTEVRFQDNTGDVYVTIDPNDGDIFSSGSINTEGTIIGSNTTKIANTKRFQGSSVDTTNVGNWVYSDNESENKDDNYDNDAGFSDITSGTTTLAVNILARSNKYIVPTATTASKWTGIATHTNDKDLSVGLWKVTPVDNNNSAVALYEITQPVTVEGKGNTKMRTFSVDIQIDSGSLAAGDLIIPLVKRESGTSSGAAFFQSTLLFYTEV